MPNPAAHTPTPWVADGDDVLVTLPFAAGTITTMVAQGCVAEYAGEASAADNAAHIVRCVNAHDALVAALRALLGGETVGGEAGHVDYADAVKMARAALAALDGEGR